MSKNQELADFIWSVADLLRGDYKRSEYGKVILPLTDVPWGCRTRPTLTLMDVVSGRKISIRPEGGNW